MQELNFEHHPLFILLCSGVGLFYAWIQYQKKGTWSLSVNRGLFALRAFLVTLLCTFLVSPILKQVINEIEKPGYVVALRPQA